MLLHINVHCISYQHLASEIRSVDIDSQPVVSQVLLVSINQRPVASQIRSVDMYYNQVELRILLKGIVFF
jgi:hypothetical protein